jgi:hypothetical protein
VLAETMSILPTSLANLVRKGFRESYDTEIFVSTTGEDGRDDLQD